MTVTKKVDVIEGRHLGFEHIFLHKSICHTFAGIKFCDLGITSVALAHDMLSCPCESGSWHQSSKLSNNSWIRETKEQAVMDVSGYQLHRIL